MVAEYLIGTIEAWLAVRGYGTASIAGACFPSSCCPLDETW